VTTERPVATAQIFTGIAAAMALLYFLSGILIPLVIAFVLVVLVDAVVTFIDQRWPKGAALGRFGACRADGDHPAPRPASSFSPRARCGWSTRAPSSSPGSNRYSGTSAGRSALRSRCG
jgi:hypothetical protein